MSQPASPGSSSSRSALRMAGIAGTILDITVTADAIAATEYKQARLKRACFILRGARCYGIDQQAPRARRPLIVCSHHSFFSGDFFMRRSFTLAGAAAMLVTSFIGAHAQQPLVQVGVLECRGGSSI